MDPKLQMKKSMIVNSDGTETPDEEKRDVNSDGPETPKQSKT